MASNSSKRRKWHADGATVLHELHPDHYNGSVYACPQCGGLLTVDDLDAGMLTIEDVPPVSLGGRPMVLTCKPCNNGAGTSLESHSERGEAFRRFFRDDDPPKRALAATFEYDDGLTIRGQFVNEGAGTLGFYGVPAQNHPDDIAAATSRPFTGGRVRFKGTVDMPAAAAGWVRAAYLAAFAHFGYSYIAKPSLHPIRSLLEGSPSEFAPIVWDGDRDGAARAIIIIATPEWLTDVLAVVIGPATVLLPPIDGPFDLLGTLAKHVTPENRGLHITAGMGCPWPTSPSYVLDRWIIARRAPREDASDEQ